MSEDKRLNEVIRVQKKPNSFVLLDKTFLEDERLSYKAKGILAYLLSKPDNWKVIVGNLVNFSSDGKASVYAGLKELKECGYYEKIPIRDETKQRISHWESTVYEIPVSLLTDFQEIENQDIENQFIENRERNKNYSNHNNLTKNHVQSSQDETARQSEMEQMLAVVKKNISYDDLVYTHLEDIALIDEFVSIILDALVTQSKTVLIGGEYKPRELIKSGLMKLKYDNIIHVLFQFKGCKTEIKKKSQYLLSMLYHSSMELESHYSNQYQSCIPKQGN